MKKNKNLLTLLLVVATIGGSALNISANNKKINHTKEKFAIEETIDENTPSVSTNYVIAVEPTNIPSEEVVEQNTSPTPSNYVVDVESTITPSEDEIINEGYSEMVRYGFNNNITSVYSDESCSSIIENLDQYQCLRIISSNDIYYYVLTDNNNYGFVPVANIELLPGTFVEIDISDQDINMMVDNVCILNSAVVTGKIDSPTYEGYFYIYDKETDRYLYGKDYCSHVDYWMPFNGQIGIHDADWRDEFGGDIYLEHGSHGCVNSPDATAETIYNNSEVGTKVLVHS